MKKKIIRLTTGLALGIFYVFTSLSAWAVPFNATLPDNPGPFNGGSLSYTITSPGPGAATLTFNLLGYRTVDGANCCGDTFRLTVNGNELFEGGFDMGGGGSTFINYQAPGTTFSTTTYGLWAGGLTTFSAAHTLLAGANTYIFDYGTMQGLGDEGWGLKSANITADVTTPEPTTMLLLGSGLLGLAGYGRKKLFKK